MLTTLLSFLGGSFVRAIWGEVSAWITARQDHRFEVERMKLQAEMDAAQHEREQAAIRLQHELGVQTIRVQADADLARLDAQAFAGAMEMTARPSGVRWVDAWAAAVRPALATLCLALLALHFHRSGWVLDDRGWELVGAVLGVYVADRTLFRRGK
ncbi:hypothetical protein [Azohydromonas aeria]|uniref:hypothetical protein n=1 Tax=Azohydromonas aeria TaxID=2590212 RepID=UPI0012FB04BD|nr:hypothetical protein [Azohydromonas aeria]